MRWGVEIFHLKWCFPLQQATALTVKAAKDANSSYQFVSTMPRLRA